MKLKLSSCGIVLGLVCATLCFGQPRAYVVAAKDTIWVKTQTPLLIHQNGPPGDVISGKYEVDANGLLYVPIAGVLNAQGLTLRELRAAIAARLTERMKKNVSAESLRVSRTGQ